VLFTELVTNHIAHGYFGTYFSSLNVLEDVGVLTSAFSSVGLSCLICYVFSQVVGEMSAVW